MTAILHSRGTNACAKCRREFQPGDRTSMAFIVHKAGANPRNPRELGAVLSEEFELVHVVCEDPQLLGQLIIRGSK